MASKLVKHLHKHLSGEVLESADALDYFSTDGSIFTVQPSVVVYPSDTTDVRKAMRLSWQLAERGKHLPVTARGKGTDQAGGALGSGMILAFPAHMNKLIKLTDKSVTVQPGIIYGDLNRTLKTHGRFLPPYPSSVDFSTIGGAVANNACGELTIKYGCTRDYVESLQVVLANGQLITAEKISKRELNRKKGLSDLEGEIYRKLDGLLLDNAELIEQARPQVSKNAAGYALWDVKGKDGSFDLSKLIVGTQGTLGLVTEITLKTEPFNPQTHMVVGFFDDLRKAEEAVVKLAELAPCALELVDYHLLDFLRRHHPEQLDKLIAGDLPQVVLLVEFNDSKKKERAKKVKKARKILKNAAISQHVTDDPDEMEQLWKIRHSAASVITHESGAKKALPIIEDGVVPLDKTSEFLERVYELLERHNLQIAVWGHAGDANFHMQPFLDLGSVGDRQTALKVMDEFYQLVIELGGSTSGEHNDGRLRAPYLPQVFGPEMYELFRQVKEIFDPHNILNPGVKIDVDKADLPPLMRDHYSMDHLYDHLPKH